MSLSDVPLRIANDRIESTQIAWTVEGEDNDRGRQTRPGGFDPADPAEYSGGDWHQLMVDDDTFDRDGDFAEWDFEIDHFIPSEEFGCQVRVELDETEGGPAFRWTLIHPDGTSYLIDELAFVGATGGGSVRWRDIGNGYYDDPDGYVGPDLEPGEYTIRAVVTDSEGLVDYAYYVDVVAPYDSRFESQIQFDTEVHEPDGYLDGPELYPEIQEFSLETASTRRDVTEARFESAWNDVSNSQYVELANDGETFTRVDNADTGSVTFAGANRGVDVNIGISRFGSRDTATPRFGFNGQEIESWQLFANPDAVTQEDIGTANTRAIVESDASLGETFAEAALLGGSGDALTRSLIPEFDKQEQLIVSSERLRWRND